MADPGLERTLGVLALGGVYGAAEYLTSLISNGALKTRESALQIMVGVPCKAMVENCELSGCVLSGNGGLEPSNEVTASSLSESELCSNGSSSSTSAWSATPCLVV